MRSIWEFYNATTQYLPPVNKFMNLKRPKDSYSYMVHTYISVDASLSIILRENGRQLMSWIRRFSGTLWKLLSCVMLLVGHINFLPPGHWYQEWFVWNILWRICSKHGTVRAEKQPLLGKDRTQQLWRCHDTWHVQPLLWSDWVRTYAVKLLNNRRGVTSGVLCRSAPRVYD
jgi:hypothetical protein